MAAQVILLNGGSSSGKTAIVRCLQAILPDPWLATGVDTLIASMPVHMQDSDSGVEFTADGGVSVGPGFRALQAAWRAGIVATVRAGAPVIIDDVFLGAAASQREWHEVLAGLDVLWVAVRCEPSVAAGRELARADRVRGMAVSQAEVVHRGVIYDVEVDTTHAESLACAQATAARALSRV